MAYNDKVMKQILANECLKCIHFSVCSRLLGGMNLARCEDYADLSTLRPQGLWEKDPNEVRRDGEIYDYRCSVCKGSAYEGQYGNHDDCSLYCPHCGTLMKL